jgi:hypothetical protein
MTLPSVWKERDCWFLLVYILRFKNKKKVAHWVLGYFNPKKEKSRG